MKENKGGFSKIFLKSMLYTAIAISLFFIGYYAAEFFFGYF